MESELNYKIEGYKKSIDCIESNIEDLEYEKSSLEYEIYRIEKKLEKNRKKKKIKDKRDSIKEEIEKADNKFDKNIKKASLFTSLENNSLSKISLLEDKIVALDGFTGIIINENIPKNKQNTALNLDLVTEDLISKKTLELINNVYSTTKEGPNVELSVKKEEFFNVVENTNDKENECYIFPVKDKKVAIKTEFVERALVVFEDNDEILVTLPNNERNGLLIENNKYTVILMPFIINN